MLFFTLIGGWCSHRDESNKSCKRKSHAYGASRVTIGMKIIIIVKEKVMPMGLVE